MTTYFITGATGVVGSGVAGELLRNGDVRLKLLIRARSDAELRTRLEGVVRFLELEPNSIAGRVEGVRGDTTQPRLGLEPNVYDRLARECTHIVHAAAAVRMNLPLEEARQSAVTATRNVIALADECRQYGVLQKVEMVSTVGVGGRRPGILPERWINEPREFHNTYERSKAEAEDIVASHIERGLPATVHRPSMVIGDARSGRIIHFQIFYHLAEFLTGRRTFGFLPNPGSTRLDLVPVDYVARAITWSSARRDTVGQVLHLCSGPQASMPILPLSDRVRARFERAGLKLPRRRVVPAGLFRAAIPVAALFASERDRRALSTLPVFLDYLAEAQEFDNTETRRQLSAAGIELPAMEPVVDRVLDYYLSNAPRRA